MIEQRDMANLDIVRQIGRVDRKAVIHRRDLDLVRVEILDRVVGTAVALMHFVCLGAGPIVIGQACEFELIRMMR